jgi:hypothetical protein
MALHENALLALLRLMRSAALEPIVVKGWSVARLYAKPWLRPYGDIDLCVRPESLSVAITALRSAGVNAKSVDLHSGVADLDRGWETIYQRSRLLLLLQGSEVRILGAEDQLRHLALHMFRHGAWRPLWLCDVAAAMESLPRDFDVDYFLHGGDRKTKWVLAALALAQELLGARVRHEALAAHIDSAPRWLVMAVLRQWGSRQPIPDPRPALSYWRDPLAAWKAAYRRWRNPIETLFLLQGSPFLHLPAALAPLLAFCIRSIRFLLRGRPARSQFSNLQFDLHLTGQE